MPEEIDTPDLAYQPPVPEDPSNIALVGCGDITDQHLAAYTEAGWDVLAFCDIDEEMARARRDEYYPSGDVYTDAADVYARDDVGVVDVATHPEPREGLIEDAIRAGKHVLSQKPFVLDLDAGERLAELADEHGVKLAVNQNGRWAPHWSFVRHAVRGGYVGEVLGVHLDAHWDHDWIADERFDEIHHAILYDYAIHYFDLVACVMQDRDPDRVYASVARSPAQTATPPLLGQATIEYEGAQASLVFDGNVARGTADRTYVGGTEGTVRSEGPHLTDQAVSLYLDDCVVRPDLAGSWFPTGFQGTMGELLSAIEDHREPENSGWNNLASLELCYAAVAAAEDGEPKVPGEVRVLRQGRGGG